MKYAPLILALMLSGCVSISIKPPELPEMDQISFKPTTFATLPNWQGDTLGEALATFQKSCEEIADRDPDADFGGSFYAGKNADWQSICNNFPLLPTDDEARQFFEANFTPYEVWGGTKTEGLFTGYYEPTLYGSLTKHDEFNIPLYARPMDLVSVNLGKFSPDLKGKNITGRLEEGSLVPYYKRDEIEEGALEEQGLEVVWVDDATDAFFLHIQGSGVVLLDNGKVMHLGYAAQNGQAYEAIGKELIRRGALTKETVSMQTIRAWLEQNPEQVAEVMNLNPSYIFFRILEDGAVGAEGIPLTPRRSMAVDRKKIPYGTPVMLDAEEPEGGARMQRLMIAQDTGGAIKGSVRGDFFWGPGEEAAHKAGLMKSKGRYWVLLPRNAQIPSGLQWKPWRVIWPW